MPSPDEGQRVRDEMRAEKDANVLLLAFDFNADVEKGGRLWRMAFKALEADEGKVAIFMNGKPFAADAVGLFEPQPGANRVLFVVENRSVAPFQQELSIRSVPDGTPATFSAISIPPQSAHVRPALGYMLDISRNKVPTMPTLRRIVGILADCEAKARRFI